MKAIRNKTLSSVGVFLLMGLSVMTNAQTTGTLTFSCNATAPSGNYGSKHVMAIWVENNDNPTLFVKTKAKYGYEDDHLTSWIAKSNSNLVDAVTGATLRTNGVQTVVWDGTNVNQEVVTDGTYNVLIEMGWGDNKVTQHSVMSFSFTKGPNSVHLTPAGNSYYTNVSVDWAPTATLVNAVEDYNSVSVFPNPANGNVNIDFKESIPSAKITVENPSGETVLEDRIAGDFKGIYTINLSSKPSGLYLVKVATPTKQFVYKIILNN